MSVAALSAAWSKTFDRPARSECFSNRTDDLESTILVKSPSVALRVSFYVILGPPLYEPARTQVKEVFENAME